LDSCQPTTGDAEKKKKRKRRKQRKVVSAQSSQSQGTISKDYKPYVSKHLLETSEDGAVEDVKEV
jgi:hypothetical protein